MSRAHSKHVGRFIVRVLFLVLSVAIFHEVHAAASAVQAVAKAAPGSASSFSLSFPASTAAGDLILVGFDFDTNSTPSSVTDSQGNVFIEVGSQLTSPGGSRGRVYFAKNIKGGPDTVTINLSANSGWIELYLTEYSGVDKTNPIDAQAGASGNAGPVSSGNAATTVAGDVIYGHCVGDWVCTAGSGFTARSVLNGNLIEDKTAGNPGAYAAISSANNGWSMQMVALRPASSSDTTPPSVPSKLSATPVSSFQINLSWTASTDNVGVTGYRVFRNGLQAGTTAATSYTDTNLAASTTYSYTVAAFDAAGNVSMQSTAASATTFPLDTVPPSVPTNLSGTSPLPTQVNLSWSASTDNVGVAGYRIYRNSAQVGTSTGTSYIDTGLAASTTYTYAIAAFDAAGNVSASSSPSAITTAAAVSQPVYPLKISSNGRYLVDQNDAPVFLTGDAPQMLSLMLSNSDVITYLADRSARGYNAIWVILTDQLDQNNAPKDFFGNVPFDGAWFTNPNATYWAHQDSVIQQAAAYGMTVFVQPSFVGNSDGNVYDTPAYLASSDATMTAYGTFLGNRYQGFKNIVWVLGGDYNPAQATIKTKLTDLATGLAAADPNHLITIEACQGCSPKDQSSLDSYGNSPPPWLGLNWIDVQQPAAVVTSQKNYSRTPFLPPLAGEDWYELENSITGFQARQEGYWEVLGGAYTGRLFGNGPIWSFNATHSGHTSPSWQSQLSSAGSVGQQYLGQLMRSREHWLMAPDTNNTVLTAGFGSAATLSVAARSTDGQTIIAYLSDGNATAKTLNMAKITSASSTAKAWWYNPQTSAATLIGTFPNSGVQHFTAPDGNDWVLVIDDASANLPAPGSGTGSTGPGVQVTRLTCSPTTLASGATSTCTVTLNQSSPSGGTAVALTNTNTAALSVAASVTIASGASTGTSPATAATVTTPQSATVTASLGTTSASASVSVRAPVLVTSLACNPTTIASGTTSTCTVTLNQPSPSGGTAVALTNTNTAALSVPASVAVGSGASTTTFVATAAVLTSSQSATVTAKLGTSSFSVSLTLVASDTVLPSVSIHSPISGQTVSGTATLSAIASDNVGVAWVQFKVDGVNVGPQIVAAPYNYSLNTTSLTNAKHTIVAVASDSSGNTATSAAVSITVNNAAKPISLVQIRATTSSASTKTLSLTFPSSTVAGDLILVGFDFDTNSTPSSVTDSQGNVFIEVGSQLTSPGGARSRVYFAKNIKGGPDTVTINLSANSGWIELYLTEYSGVDKTNPVDAQAGASGNPGAVSSGNVTTTMAGDVIYGYCVGDWVCTAGSGLVARSTFDGNLIEDKTAGNPGTYGAIGSATRGWTMQAVALKKAQ
jgi:chitodextrinase